MQDREFFDLNDHNHPNILNTQFTYVFISLFPTTTYTKMWKG